MLSFAFTGVRFGDERFLGINFNLQCELKPGLFYSVLVFTASSSAAEQQSWLRSES
jgi:hypothetical protein